MAGNSVTLEFAGDATRLQRAARQASQATEDVARAARDAGGSFQESAQDASRFEQRMGSLGAATTGLTDAVDTLGGGMQALADIQDHARAQASRLARASFDVADAQENMKQATRDAAAAQNDGKRAALDMEIALLDQKDAQEEYNKAVKKYGKDSDEAKRALTDVKAAGLDYAEAQEDANQAVRDGARASLDAKEAQLNLNDAMHEANPPELQQWADKLSLVTPLLSAVVGVLSLVTVAQMAWNAAQLANPLTWIILGIIALIAIIAVLVWKWDWVKKAAGKAWDWIKEKASSAWNWLKELPGKIGRAFAKVTDYLFAPFRAAFNKISDAWNHTIGSLSWSVPGWVPGVGGNSISVPDLPKFHTGGKIPGLPGQEVPIMGLAGETVLPAGRSGGGQTVYVRGDGLVDALIELLSNEVRRRGGDVQLVLGGRNAA